MTLERKVVIVRASPKEINGLNAPSSLKRKAKWLGRQVTKDDECLDQERKNQLFQTLVLPLKR